MGAYRRWHFFAAEKEQFVAEIPLPENVATVRCGHPGVRAEMEPSEVQGEPALLVLRYRYDMCVTVVERSLLIKLASVFSWCLFVGVERLRLLPCLLCV